MKLLAICSLIFGILGCGPVLASAQDKSAVVQQAGDCSVNITGNNNTTASLVCNGVDPKLAQQIRAIVNGTRRNETVLKEMSEKLDRMIKQMDQEAIPPVMALRFVYPKSPALVLMNQSEAIARNIKWTVTLWNMDLPDRNDPLPIPTTLFDFIRPHDESGPQNLFDGSLVAPLLKPGNRLFGTAAVICPECARGRTYVVYIVWGENGWFSEVENEQSGRLLIPNNFLKATRIEYFKELEAAVPAQSRTPIAER
jgi:hypothetical protein